MWVPTPQIRWVSLGVFVLICVVTQGCKKPTVEEDKGVLPLPQAPTREAAAAESTVPTDEPVKEEETPIPLDGACTLLDEYMKSYGVQFSDRDCGRLLVQTDMLRLDGYSFERTENVSTKVRENVNACFWKSDKGDEWRVAYLDRMNRPCRSADDFCKLGANRVIYEWSHDACPSDTVHRPALDTEMLQSMVGTWALSGTEGETLEIASDGRVVRTMPDDTRSLGTFKPMSATQWELDVDGTRQSVFVALIDNGLYWSRGVILPDGPAGSFMMPLPGEKRIRRYKDSCYLISARPSDYPMHVPCTVRTAGDGKKHWEIKLSDSRLLTLHKVGAFWMDSESVASRYERMNSPAK